MVNVMILYLYFLYIPLRFKKQRISKKILKKNNYAIKYRYPKNIKR